MRHTEKSGPDFSVCLIRILSCGADFSKNGADFLKNLVDFLKNLVDFLKNLVDFLKNLAAVFWFGQVGSSPVAPVAFLVALPRGQFAPVNHTIPDG